MNTASLPLAKISARNLAMEPPRSPRVRVGGYVILGRTIDKCRALLAGTTGDYHYGCPLDNMLFEFKGIGGEIFKRLVKTDADDDEIVNWLNPCGIFRTPGEIKQWGDTLEAARPFDDPDQRAWFVRHCIPLGLDPRSATFFDWLEADDAAAFSQPAAH